MYFAQSELVDRSVVRLGSVALVLFKAILRIFLRHLLHVSVPGHLRQNGSRRDTRRLFVTLYNESELPLQRRKLVSVDKHDPGFHTETAVSPLHRKEIRLK